MFLAFSKLTKSPPWWSKSDNQLVIALLMGGFKFPEQQHACNARLVFVALLAQIFCLGQLLHKLQSLHPSCGMPATQTWPSPEGMQAERLRLLMLERGKPVGTGFVLQPNSVSLGCNTVWLLPPASPPTQVSMAAGAALRSWHWKAGKTCPCQPRPRQAVREAPGQLICSGSTWVFAHTWKGALTRGGKSNP